MKNGNLTDFLDHLYYGGELLIEFHGTQYFLQGWWTDEGNAVMTVDKVEPTSFEGYLWKCESTTMKICAETFLKEPLWEGKDFLLAQEDVTWLD